MTAKSWATCTGAPRGRAARIASATIRFTAAVLAIACWQVTDSAAAQDPAQVSDFGSNPGDLKMFLYVPSSLPAGPVPVVVSMHGCNQNGRSLIGRSGETSNATGHAAAIARDSEWNVLADRYGFIVIYPEQTVRFTQTGDSPPVNNDYGCFNWAGFYGQGMGRGNGESASIVSMIEHVQANHTVDDRRIFATGLSAGAGMAMRLLAEYPDVFAAGAPMSGLVYGCATWDGATGDVIKTRAFNCMGVDDGFNQQPGGMAENLKRSPAEWAEIARAGGPPGYSGPYPRVMVWQGDQDQYVDIDQMQEIVDQWTALHGADQTVDDDTPLKASHSTHDYRQYQDASGQTVVSTVTIRGMAHGLSIDRSGSGDDAGGQRTSGVVPFAYWAHDTGLYSSYYAAEFFGLLEDAPVMPGTDAGVPMMGTDAGQAMPGTDAGQAMTGTDAGQAVTGGGADAGVMNGGGSGHDCAEEEELRAHPCQVGGDSLPSLVWMLGLVGAGLWLRRRRVT